MHGNEVPITISPATVKSATGQGSAINLQGYLEVAHEEMAFILQVGAVSVGTTLDVKLQHSADGSTDWQDIASGAFAQVLTAADEKFLRCKPPRKYIRENHTIVGTSYTFAVIGVGTKTKDG